MAHKQGLAARREAWKKHEKNKPRTEKKGKPLSTPLISKKVARKLQERYSKQKENMEEII
jgi:hypothetical protein